MEIFIIIAAVAVLNLMKDKGFWPAFAATMGVVVVGILILVASAQS